VTEHFLFLASSIFSDWKFRFSSKVRGGGALLDGLRLFPGKQVLKENPLALVCPPKLFDGLGGYLVQRTRGVQVVTDFYQHRGEPRGNGVGLGLYKAGESKEAVVDL
jgi:hypothetical protein